jgi:ribosomal protein S18 acetylase RimI-like enzyme
MPEPTVILRPMTPAEYDTWQLTLAEGYAAEKVAAGSWAEEGAVQRALDESTQLLPDGANTAGMLIFRAIATDGRPVGRAWVGLDHPRGEPDTAFLYDIEVDEAERGKGFGRALLSAVEEAVRAAGVGALTLNVFEGNGVATGLYESSGYATTTRQMRKGL